MKKIKIIIPVAAMFLIEGCSNSTYKIAVVKSKYVTQSSIAHLPLLVDLSVDDNRANGTFSSRTDLGLEYAKTQAVANALKKSNADVLLQPQYLFENTGSFFNVDVSGLAAHYKNFRQATASMDTLAFVP